MPKAYHHTYTSPAMIDLPGSFNPIGGGYGTNPERNRLVDLGDQNVPPDKDQAAAPITEFKELFPPEGNAKVGIDLIKDLYFTCMYPANAGQIRYANDRSRTIPLNVHGLDVLDFAHPNADLMNKKTKVVLIDTKPATVELWKWKSERKDEARVRVEKRVRP